MNNKLQVLLVEDHNADARLVQEALVDCNVIVELNHLRNGAEAVDFLRSEVQEKQAAPQPDLIILDLNMPCKDGHEFLADMKDYLDATETPVILLTVSDRHEDVEKAMAKKLNFYLSKPVDAEKLQRIISAVDELWVQRRTG